MLSRVNVNGTVLRVKEPLTMEHCRLLLRDIHVRTGIVFLGNTDLKDGPTITTVVIQMAPLISHGVTPVVVSSTAQFHNVKQVNIRVASPNLQS